MGEAGCTVHLNVSFQKISFHLPVTSDYYILLLFEAIFLLSSQDSRNVHWGVEGLITVKVQLCWVRILGRKMVKSPSKTNKTEKI